MTHPPLKVKAPFLLTQMNHMSQPTWICVWSRRGRQLENGVAPWRKPWRTELPVNLVSWKAYRGLNVFLLGCQGYGSRYWLTFNQAAKLGGHVRKGERSSLVTFWHIGEEKIIRDSDG